MKQATANQKKDASTLHLTLNKKWFDMILSGVKKEEYREVKIYWVKRLSDEHLGMMGADFMDKHKVIAYTFRKFTHIHFTNGYGKKAPCFTIECKGIKIGTGNPEWGAPDTKVFILSLGDIVKQ